MDDSILSSLEGDVFTFACHKDIECFNRCCSDLHLVLSPYDILRLKNRLSMTSEEFLEGYAVPVKEGQTIFPTVRLKMQDDLKCPFVSPGGCSVYEDRPGACRTYPLARAASMAFGDGGREKYFTVTESHCLGHREDKKWSLEEWKEDQGLNVYNEFNDHWMGVITHPAVQKGVDLTDKKVRMFNLACYNTEKFRDFVFNTRFLDIFNIELSIVEEIKKDDAALLKFAMQWLRFSLFGEKTLALNDGFTDTN